MKRSAIILASGLLLAVLGAAITFKVCHRTPAAAAAPELGWLAAEFQLSPADCKRIEEFHHSYQEQCARMCEKIARKNQEIRELLAKTNAVTPELSQKLNEAALLRSECHARMLEHFLKVSAAMPPEQGRRYLDWVLERTILADSGMVSHPPSGAHNGEH